MNRHIAAALINYKNTPLTIRCIESLKESGINDIIVIDNSADAEEQNKIEVAVQKLENEVDAIRLIVLSENVGFSKGINIAIEKLSVTEPQYILLINNDAYFSGISIDLLINEMEQQGAEFLSCAESNRRFFYNRYLGILTRKALPGSFQYLHGSCILYHFQKNKELRFDEEFFLYGEDVELSWRISKEHKNIVFSKLCVEHEGGASSISRSLFYEYHINRGHYLLAKKLSRNTPDYLISLVMKFPVLLARSIYRSIKTISLFPLFGFFLSPFEITLRA